VISREFYHISKLLDEILYQTHATHLLISIFAKNVYSATTSTAFIISLVPAPASLRSFRLERNDPGIRCCQRGIPIV
jgi:hypothetical protein